MSWSRRFVVEGVFWRQLLRFAILIVPLWLEPVIMATWTLIFLLWGPGRRGVMRNLSAILPGSFAFANFFRVYRVMWNFAWTIADTVRFKETRVAPDWDFVGTEHFAALEQSQGGAIILTAHMGSYDLGAQLFAEISKRHITMVRAPENDPETREFEEAMSDRTTTENLKIDFSTRASDLALDLLGAVQRGEIVAIQGDRVTPGVATLEATLFGKKTLLPAGPFALAMAARVPIYPLFTVRMGRRRYRLVVAQPFEVVRTRDRAVAFERALNAWTSELERAISDYWFQWFAFAPYSEELA
ncbi:MAG: lysophospholipid acyltransferase family protein [Acidobacteriota bacterium]|nr:lysophospholipid acyltransferase family protein [Acidobacteriota bacterium]